MEERVTVHCIVEVVSKSKTVFRPAHFCQVNPKVYFRSILTSLFGMGVEQEEEKLMPPKGKFDVL